MNLPAVGSRWIDPEEPDYITTVTRSGPDNIVFTTRRKDGRGGTGGGAADPAWFLMRRWPAR